MVRKKGDDEGPRTLICGVPDLNRCDNKINTSKYSLLTFIPVAVMEQFRRVANLYFLLIGVIMAVGWYTDLYESAISPWTTLGPLAIVISISLLQEGLADLNRHKSDATTNTSPCVVMKRTEDVDPKKHEPTILEGREVAVNLNKSYFSAGQSVGGPATPRQTRSDRTCLVAFERIRRMDIRQGHFVLVRNRDMVPADLVLLASSSDNGSAYIETSSIDGETNLKLRSSPHIPDDVMDAIRPPSASDLEEDKILRESLHDASKRITRFSALAYPAGKNALQNPANPEAYHQEDVEDADNPPASQSGLRLKDRTNAMIQGVAGGLGDLRNMMRDNRRRQSGSHLSFGGEKYVAALKSEPPNASVNTFSGSLTLPPVDDDGPSIVIPLNAENMLLRGAVLRNTEWAIGVACFTGKDTKLVRNSFDTPSKFSELDRLMNKTVLVILVIMIFTISVLATLSTSMASQEFDKLWYVGLSSEKNKKWPYFPEEIGAPDWETKPRNWVQVFFLFVTLLNNLVPLSLYVTVEVVTAALRIFIGLDINMYHPETDTRCAARSTTVTDLGQVQYVFSDKTGTLTQNVMRFKRCSVDGNVFGAPVQKAAPNAQEEEEVMKSTANFHPLKRLLTGRIIVNSPDSDMNMIRRQSADLEGLGGSGVPEDPGEGSELTESKYLTFNSEMFLRVMSLCHTVVVEKDLDLNQGEVGAAAKWSTKSTGLGSSVHGAVKKLFGRKSASYSNLRDEGDERNPGDGETAVESKNNTPEPKTFDYAQKGKDGAPLGYAYQAESPDEGALVQASSMRFDFQVVGRDSSGIKLACSLPSLLADEGIINGFKDGTLAARSVAAETASPSGTMTFDGGPAGGRVETWQILAVNKFDSTRKRMSVLVRSPAELGSIPMLLCKGADTAMLDPNIIDGGVHVMKGGETDEEITRKSSTSPRRPIPIRESCRTMSTGSTLTVDEMEEEDWERSVILGIQAHLGDFAREGLRTLVLGVRVLTEKTAQKWLDEYNAAAAAINDRDKKLTAAAQKIERKLHIVGATAIEDKLQDGVPNTIAKLGAAGIKLWVLTGDKRETAKEIGYATNVLNEKMSPLIEVAAGSEVDVRTRMAMEFMKLVKFAKLPEYQRVAVDQNEKGFNARLERFFFKLAKFKRRVARGVGLLYHKYLKLPFVYFLDEVSADDPAVTQIEEAAAKETDVLMATERRQGVRNRAEKIVTEYVKSLGGKESDASEAFKADGPPDVFSRGQSARLVMAKRRSLGQVPSSELRGLTLANETAKYAAEGSEQLVDEDVLSMRSILGTEGETSLQDFDRAKRTLLERIFAVDREVRHGRLLKHLREEKLSTINEGQPISPQKEGSTAFGSLDGPRALVIEGAALDRLLGDTQMEEILFAVASSCDSVVACRVSPAQKAQLVQLVRRYVVPEPVTLAIGDGANDVGMIQEAHVGIGISGKEGQQAVNASDFAIAQFRFLEELLLVHGRWNFLRQATVVLFSFYKNAVMAGCLIIFSRENMYSGTPLFDEWVIAMLNFIAAVPIGSLGFYDRCLDKDYIRAHPEVYNPTRTNEILTRRVLFRWIVITVVHIGSLYFLTVPALAMDGGGLTSAMVGLMWNIDPDTPGDGEGGDLKSVGLVTFTCMVVLFGYKVAYESRSIIIGQWPSFTCKKHEDGTTFVDRTSLTWFGTAYMSYAFHIAFIYTYSSLGRKGPSMYSYFVNSAQHTWHTRSVSWLMILFVPIAAMAFDVAGKLFSNLFYPTQTQIHVEIFVKGKDSKPLPHSPHSSGKQDSGVQEEADLEEAV